MNIETIRCYERRGLLPKPPRTQSGYRMFSFDDVRRVRFIKRAQELGFSLKEIEELLALQREPRSTRGDVRERAEAKIADIEEKLRDLEAMKRGIERLTAACSGRGPLCGCPMQIKVPGQPTCIHSSVKLISAAPAGNGPSGSW